MKMSNSPLVSFTKISPHKTSPRQGEIDRISIHCLPVDETELLTKTGWIKLRDIRVGDIIATSDPELNITFDKVQHVVPISRNNVYKFSTGLMATSEHRILCKTQKQLNHTDRPFIVKPLKELIERSNSYFIPQIGKYKGNGLPLSDDEINFLCSIQADGHYVKNSSGEVITLRSRFYKQRKIKEFAELLKKLNIVYKKFEIHKTTGTLFDGMEFNIKDEYAIKLCNEWLDNKVFKWDFLEFNREQALHFAECLPHWDGQTVHRNEFVEYRYSSYIKQNIDIVTAVLLLNGISTRLNDGHTLYYKQLPYRSIGSRYLTEVIEDMEVSCVTVPSGFIVIRQNGRPLIVGNSMASDLSIETCGNWFSNPNAEASSNYGIGSDGRIGLYVDEGDRSWCTSSRNNDHHAITIEVAAYEQDEYACTDEAYEALICLLVDICQRNDIPELRWKNDPDVLDDPEYQNLNPHRFFASTACLPLDTEVLKKDDGWVQLKDVLLGDEVAAVNGKDLSIEFQLVKNIIDQKEDSVLNLSGIEATPDHRMLLMDEEKKLSEDVFANVCREKKHRIPTAGLYKSNKGSQYQNKELELMILLNALATYAYGIDHERKMVILSDLEELDVEAVKKCLDKFKYNYRLMKPNGKFEIVSSDVDLLNFTYFALDKDRSFGWELLKMTEEQAVYFVKLYSSWNRLEKNGFYYVNTKKSLDVLSALCATHRIGVETHNNGCFGIRFNSGFISADQLTKNEPTKNIVTCVSVDATFILVRQNGRTLVVGNCPGEYLMSRYGDIADEVNRRLNGGAPSTYNKPSSNEEELWNYFAEVGLNPMAIAGVLGNIYAESGLSSINLQNNFESTLGMNDKEYTDAVDSGSYTNFVHDGAGYGLAQWTYYTRKQGLYDWAKECDSSIGDLGVQKTYLWKELQEMIDIAKLNASKSVREASDIVLLEFERPADQSEDVQILRASYAQEIYDKFVKEETPTEENTFEPFNIQVTADCLNIRSGPGTNFDVTASIMDRGIYGISEVADGPGGTQWGRMSNEWGWIALKYTKKVDY